MSLARKVYIIGFMGSGKSTAGKKLAASMGWQFVDLDRKIEESAGKTISRIFEEEGEDYFRKLESDMLRKISSDEDIIISTGGGTPCHGDNLEYMSASGITVYLKLTPVQLAGRLIESSGGRPLIKNLRGDQLLGFIETRLAEREKYYSKANVIMEGSNVDISKLHSIITSWPQKNKT